PEPICASRCSTNAAGIEFVCTREKQTVQNQNLSKVPARHKSRQVNPKGAARPPPNKIRFRIHSRHCPNPATQASRASTAAANSPKNNPGCLHKNDKPKSSPLRNIVNPLPLSRARNSNNRPPSAWITTRCVACACNPSTPELSESSTYAAQQTSTPASSSNRRARKYSSASVPILTNRNPR